MHILMTRPLDDSKEMILRFKDLGHKVSHMPLIEIEKVNFDDINFNNYKALIFTSANSLKFLDIKKLIKTYFVFVLELQLKKKL